MAKIKAISKINNFDANTASYSYILSASVAYFSVLVDFSISTSPKSAPEEKIRTYLISRYTSYADLSCIFFFVALMSDTRILWSAKRD